MRGTEPSCTRPQLAADAGANFRLPDPFKVAPAILDDPIGCIVFEATNQHGPHHPPVLDSAGVLLVLRDVPDVPLPCERQRLTLRQRLALTALCGADRRDLRFDRGGKFADADLRVLRSGRQDQLRLPPLSVPSLTTMIRQAKPNNCKSARRRGVSYFSGDGMRSVKQRRPLPRSL
jgi:hypothetical protein